MKVHKSFFKQKMLIVLTIIVLMFNIILPVKSHAVSFKWFEGLGGTLWTPVQELVLGIGDAIYTYILQPAFIEGAPDAVFKTTKEELQTGKTSLPIPILSHASDALTALKMWVTGETESFGEGWAYQRNELVFPSIYYSVENIFANKIPAFDVNFINPSVETPSVISNGGNVKEQAEVQKYVDEFGKGLLYKLNDDGKAVPLSAEAYSFENKVNEIIEQVKNNSNATEGQKAWAEKADGIINGNLGFSSKKDYNSVVSGAYEQGISLGSTINSSSSGSDTHAIGNIAKQLGGVISKWYNTLRDLALVAMLSVLVYIAIRIILSSTVEEAKYKTMLKDWLMAVVLLFMMHYIMAFALHITQSITDLLYGMYTSALQEQTSIEPVSETQISSQTLASSVRMEVSLAQDAGQAMGYTITYALLVVYTIMFTWQYLKRVVYMAFLTIISPLVAITYPIDKVGDGKAQAFNMWLKEYVFNLLIQPVHLLLFTILAVSAMDLFTSSVVYSLIILGFLLQSVKIFKKFFGFDKAPTGGSFTSGFAGGALFSSALGMLQKVPGIPSRNKKSDGTSGSSDNSSKINFADGSNRGKELKNLAGFDRTSGGSTRNKR